MDKKHLCSRKQPYPEKSAILMPDGHTCGLPAKVTLPSSSQTICRQVRTKMGTCVRSIGHRCAFLPALGACFQHVLNRKVRHPYRHRTFPYIRLWSAYYSSSLRSSTWSPSVGFSTSSKSVRPAFTNRLYQLISFLISAGYTRSRS